MSIGYICDHCKKVHRAESYDVRKFKKPKKWFELVDENILEHACCEVCLTALKERKGKIWYH